MDRIIRNLCNFIDLMKNRSSMYTTETFFGRWSWGLWWPSCCLLCHLLCPTSWSPPLGRGETLKNAIWTLKTLSHTSDGVLCLCVIVKNEQTDKSKNLRSWSCLQMVNNQNHPKYQNVLLCQFFCEINIAILLYLVGYVHRTTLLWILDRRDAVYMNYDMHPELRILPASCLSMTVTGGMYDGAPQRLEAVL